MTDRIHRTTQGITPLDNQERVYEVYDGDGRLAKLLATVVAKDLSGAAEQVSEHWPCVLKAPHLPYKDGVDVEKDGTLSFYRVLPGEAEPTRSHPKRRRNMRRPNR